MTEKSIEILKVIPEKVVEKVYDDALSKPAQQVGKLGEDAMKTARLILAPIQILGALQDRFDGWVETIRQRVPEERRTQAPPEIAGPVIEGLKYTSEDSPLKEMYLNLLARSIDKERQSEAHPSFPKIIGQLSRDEAVLLTDLGPEANLFFSGNLARNNAHHSGDAWGYCISVDKAVEPKLNLFFPDRLFLYLDHLLSLNLMLRPFPTEGSYTLVFGGTTACKFATAASAFGSIFIRACIEAQ